MRRRIVIEVPEDQIAKGYPQTGASVISGPGEAITTGPDSREAWLGFIPDAYIVENESIPDPLPTQPGAVFIGYGAKAPSAHEPCRWMVVHDVDADADGKPDPARITYISQRYQEWSPDEAKRYGLCVLPDPEVAP